MDAYLAQAETLFRTGRMVELLDLHVRPSADPTRVQHDVFRGMALFETGRVLEAIPMLRAALAEANRAAPALECSIALALVGRESQFQAPDETLPLLSEVRQRVAAAGDAASIGHLHLVVARLEACRGHCITAKRHLEIARHLSERGDEPSLRATIDVVDSSLEMYSGNLQRARDAAARSFERAQTLDLGAALASASTNLGFLALCAGDPDKASEYLDHADRLSGALAFIRLCSTDSRVQVAMFQRRSGDARRALDACSTLLAAHHVPARSWYDLAHDTTRCMYFETQHDWARIVDIATDAEPELVRRQFRAVRTALLGAKARALARLGRHTEADTELAAALRACPRGAIDPLIILEASTAVCRALRGDSTAAAVHFDRALAGCRAIGHRYHEAWIDGQRADLLAARSAVPSTRPAVDPAGTALLLGDVAAILGAGHSIDLLSHRLLVILQSTSLGGLEAHSESNLEPQIDPSVTCDLQADGTFTLRLRGSDRLVVIRAHGVRSLEEISLVKSVTDLVEAAMARATEVEREDADENLWPKTPPAGSDETVFRSPRMVEVVNVARRLASADIPVLISGETGTGKDVLARLVHRHSRVDRGPFIACNCATMPRDLVESQLFGHRRGAFTGAYEASPGVIRAAERGTLFLDEIGDLDPAVQPKLLRFLETGEIHPVGETRPVVVRVRVVAATNADLEELVAQGRFRRDLFYRIGAAKLTLPPLRERKDEIPALAALFFDRYARECQRRGLRVADDLIAALLLFDWPGNIRQLANEIRRVVALAEDGDLLGSDRLAPEMLGRWKTRPHATAPPRAGVHVRLDQPLEQAIADLERQFIEHAMATASGRVAEAAEILGLSRKGLFLKRRRQGLLPRDRRAAGSPGVVRPGA